VKCKVNNKFEGVIKLTMSNLNSLWKHVGHKKAMITTTSVIFYKQTNMCLMNVYMCPRVGILWCNK
jgi:hypothetical protein